MIARNKDELLQELCREVQAIQHLIEEVIYLDGMRQALQNAESNFQTAKLLQQNFYDNCKIPLTSSNLEFLNTTLSGRAHLSRIIAAEKDMRSIRLHIRKLECERDLRMKPFNDLIDHVRAPNTTINEDYSSALLNTASVLNPEGSILDRIKMLAKIIISIVTFRCHEISDICVTQQKRNSLRSNIHSLFNTEGLKVLPSDIVPQQFINVMPH